jgi:hypothetical protein
MWAATHSVPEDGLSSGLTHTVDVLQRDLNALVVGDLNVVHTDVLNPQRSAARSGHLHSKAWLRSASGSRLRPMRIQAAN